MGSNRNSFSETANQRQSTKADQCNGALQRSSDSDRNLGRDLGPLGSDPVRSAGDNELNDWTEKGSQWIGTGELEVVRPETHPEIFVPVAPDGGWSWVVLLASFLCSMIIDGILFSVGLLLADLSDCFKTTKAKLALVGSLFLGCYQIIGPIVAALINRFGCRAVAITGALLASFAMFISSFATNMDFLLCTFGVVVGSAFGLIHLPAMISVNFYFNRRRAMANGIAVVGTPVGAVVFGPLTSYLLQVYHWSNTLIIFSGLLLHCVALACLYRPLRPTIHLSSVHTHSVPEGLDDLIAEELNSGFFASNGYIRSIATFASNGRIVHHPLIEVDEPAETKPLVLDVALDQTKPCDVTPERSRSNTSREKQKTELPETKENAGNVALSRSNSNQSAISAPSALSAYNSDEEDGKETMEPKTAPTTGPVEDEQTLGVEGKPNGHDKSEAETKLISDASVPSEVVESEIDREKSAIQPAVPTQNHRSVDIPSIRVPDTLEKRTNPFRRASNVSCILSTPCLGGFQIYQDRLSSTHNGSPHSHHGNRYYYTTKHRLPGDHRHYQRLQHYQKGFHSATGNSVTGVHHNSFSRIRKHTSAIPTIEEGHVLEHIPNNLVRSESSQGAVDGTRDYNSSVTLACLAKESGRRQRIRGSPSIHSGALHQSAFSGLATAGVKVELVQLNEKPALLMLPHPNLSLRDYSRPMYRSDIFYSGNVAPEQGTTARLSAAPPQHSQGYGSQTRISDFIGSAFSLRPDNLSRRTSMARLTTTSFLNLESTMCLSQSNWYESYLVSLTRIPVGPVDYDQERTIDGENRSCLTWCCWRCCRPQACAMSYDEVGDTDSLQQISSLCDVLVTCIRRLRDCRLPLRLNRSKTEWKHNRRGSTTYSNKFDAGGDVLSDRAPTCRSASRGITCNLRICASKSFTDVLSTMTDLQLIRNKGYRLAFIANFFGVLAILLSTLHSIFDNYVTTGTYVPLIYVTEFAAQNGIPESMCSYLISIMGLFSIVGRLAFAWLSALLGIRPIIVQTVTQFLLGLLIALMPYFVSFPYQATAFGLMGLLSGPFASLSTIILCDLVGVDALTTAVGLITLSRGLSSVLGAPLAGLLYEWTGDFTVPYVASGMTIVLSGVLFGTVICQPSYLPEKAEPV